MRFAFVGDIYLGPEAEPWSNADIPDLHRLLGVDLVLGNFESVIDGPSVGDPQPDKIHLSTPRSSLPKLRDMGIDVVSVANNHIGDYGPESASYTIEALRAEFGSENVFGWSGRPAVELASGLRVVGACFSETNPLVPDDAARVFTADDLHDLLARETSSASRLMVYAHWGEEHLSLTAPGLRSRARQLGATGVTHVVGTHSHVVGAAEAVDGSSVIYGLGNFLFHVVRKGNTRMLRRAKRGTVAVFRWDGNSVTLEEFWRSEFDENLNLRLRKIGRHYPGSLISQLHLRAPPPLASWSYEAALSSRWFNLGLARLIEGVERPSLKKVRTALTQLGRGRPS
jgi:hypothetical protein